MKMMPAPAKNLALLALLATSALVLPSAASSQTPAQAPPKSASAAANPDILPLDQIQGQTQLDQTIMALDTALFDAYNKCDLAKFRALLADDVEFYHDNGGVTLGPDALTDSIKKNICGGDTVRVLVSGTFEAHYMKGFGAIEIGTHRFEHPKSNGPTGEGKFITLWQYKDGAWKVKRALSFDHHLVQQPAQ
jgi:Domain of unknown function (DUF4440)